MFFLPLLFPPHTEVCIDVRQHSCVWQQSEQSSLASSKALLLWMKEEIIKCYYCDLCRRGLWPQQEQEENDRREILFVFHLNFELKLIEKRQNFVNKLAQKNTTFWEKRFSVTNKSRLAFIMLSSINLINKSILFATFSTWHVLLTTY